MAAFFEHRKLRLMEHLPYRIFEELSMILNPEVLLKDWRLLADRLGYDFNHIQNWMRYNNPTMALLLDWKTNGETVSLLIDHLLEMERDDAVNILRPFVYEEGPSTSSEATWLHDESKGKRLKVAQDPIDSSIGEKDIFGVNNMQETITQEVKNPAKRSCPEDFDGYARVADISSRLSNLQQRPLHDLAKCNFSGKRRQLMESFFPGTRQWLLDQVDMWFTHDQESRVMIITAGPGVGKSVFAAKVCEVYAEKGQLAGCHFCRFNYADYRNPLTMLQSLAIHLCENVPGFREKLVEQLERPHSKDTAPDAFRVLLNDPLHALEERQPLLIVIDALDESESGGKSELLEVISEEFPQLPMHVKILITSRPELPVQNILLHLKPIEILPNNEDNKEDIKIFLQNRLSNLEPAKNVVERLVDKCEGSFLFAFHIMLTLQRHGKIDLDVVPLTISAVYKKYVDRLDEEIKKVDPNIDIHQILEIVAAAQGPLPLKFVGEALDLGAVSLSGRARPAINLKEIIRKVNESISALLLVYDDCLTVFHKTVVDWLLSSEFEDHFYKVDRNRGDEHLWRVCRKQLEGLERENPNSKKNKEQEYACRVGLSHAAYHANLIEGLKVEDMSDYSARLVWFHRKRRIEVFGWKLAPDCLITSYNKSMWDFTICDRSGLSASLIHYSEKVSIFIVQSHSENHLDKRIRLWGLKDCFNKRFLSMCYECPSAGDRLQIYTKKLDRPNVFTTTVQVTPYPKDLIDWGKRSLSAPYRHDIPHLTLSSQSGCDWSKLEVGKDFLLFHSVEDGSEKPGIPVLSSAGNAVAIGSFVICLKTGDGRETPLIKFSHRLDRVMEDIRRRKVEVVDMPEVIDMSKVISI